LAAQYGYGCDGFLSQIRQTIGFHLSFGLFHPAQQALCSEVEDQEQELAKLRSHLSR
jgi:hypothetical protein